MSGPISHFECGTCEKAFPAGWRARDNHCNATGHHRPNYECDTCPRWFHCQSACDQHMRAKNHFVHSDNYSDNNNDSVSDDCYTYNPYECRRCYDRFPSDQDRIDHEAEDHRFCNDCDRFFCSGSAAKNHRQSRVHQGQSMKCPFCLNGFVTATGLAHHLESGGCPNGPYLDRAKVWAIVRAKDPNGIISKNLLEYPTTNKYEASGRTWNGYGYECYFCSREFKQLHGLNQHLNSPVHQQALYHCPNRGCGTDFRALASVINHLESETCGFMRFRAVQNKFGQIISSNRRLTFN
ncbi:hypothetical protein QBC47DRAFT_389129 [Echria macrotheca]|uniref:C2H2-type domain-containing protein n=1 Tax=Echria macrotheca TaxID=438768 RepID=A0AAJ0B706_9PEZI|nr:hypothetical protein QBC47DRAFT_389129 [Echria macrotheca]